MAPYRRQIPSNLIICDADEATPKLIHSLPDLIVNLNNKGIRLSSSATQIVRLSAGTAPTWPYQSRLYITSPSSFPHRFTLNCRDLTSEERSAFDSHLPEDTSSYKVVEINVSCRSTTTITGFGLLLHGANETVDNWVNQHTPNKDIIALLDLLRQHSFILLVKATDAEITHAINSVNSQSIPRDYGYGENLASTRPPNSQANIAVTDGTWNDTADRSPPTEVPLFLQRSSQGT